MFTAKTPSSFSSSLAERIIAPAPSPKITETPLPSSVKSKPKE
jgi:hypothetical protein